MRAVFVVFMLLVASATDRGVVEEKCSYIEINTVYDEDNIARLRQLIFWNWQRVPYHHKDEFGNRTGSVTYQEGFGVRDYLVINKEERWPVVSKHGHSYVCCFFKDDILYEVRAGWVTYTHTYNDPEVDHRAILPITSRRRLFSR